jgi:hypothetical protein
MPTVMRSQSLPASAGLGRRLRASAAFAAGAFALHQLRYLAGHGGEAGQALEREGHGYLGFVGPLVALLCALALAQLAVALQRPEVPGRPRRLGRAWLVAAASLLAVYVVQESLEGVLSAEHPSGWTGLVGGAGWVAVPLAVGLGLAVALLLRCADALLAARGRPGRRFAPPGDASRPHRRCTPRPEGVLARNLAGRAPPFVLR